MIGGSEKKNTVPPRLSQICLLHEAVRTFFRSLSPFLVSDVFFFVSVAFCFPSRGNWSNVDIVWNIVFTVDLIINLNTGFIGETGMVSY